MRIGLNLHGRHASFALPLIQRQQPALGGANDAEAGHLCFFVTRQLEM
jgi:hypothetical protein